VLEKLSHWAHDDAPQLSTAWLNGMAGTGKSAIANTFANRMEEAGILGATFCVDRQVADRRDPHRIVQSLAYDLAARNHERLRALWSSLCANPAILDMPLRDQVDALVKKPLECASSETLVILIDGLDECNPSDGARLLSTLVTCLTCFPIKLFVASRSDREITRKFTSILPTEIRLQDQPEEEVRKDVQSYWVNGLDTLCLNQCLPDWRDIVSIELLVELTGELFIYAATVLKIIENTRGSSIAKLQALLKVSRSGVGSAIAFGGPEKPSRLEDLYVYVLTEALQDNNRQMSSEYAVKLHDILEVVLLAREPLTAPALSELLEMDRVELDSYLSTLTSVLVIPDVKDDLGVVRPFHQSFPDFILGHGHYVHQNLTIHSTIAHMHFAEHCLGLLGRKLHVDMCGIYDPSLFNTEVLGLQARLDKYVSVALRYSSRYWVVHWLEVLRAADLQNQMPSGLDELCNRHLLHWIEILSLTRVFDVVLQVMPELLAAFKVSTTFWTQRR
jgi:hypothetical protein